MDNLSIPRFWVSTVVGEGHLSRIWAAMLALCLGWSLAACDSSTSASGRIQTMEGQPIEGAEVVLRVGDNMPSTDVTGPDGGFEIWTTLHGYERHATLGVSKEGFPERVVDVVPSGRNDGLVIMLGIDPQVSSQRAATPSTFGVLLGVLIVLFGGLLYRRTCTHR